jgi:glycosyltransferase involved in cell wall biosynthesis
MEDSKESSRPLVSIITPSYNQGAFIEETIKSVLAQDYRDIEYIVVDGGSTDDTIEILKRYEGRLKWVSEPDQGQTDAIIKGFAMSSGEVLAWLNSDDIYVPGAVTRAVDFLKARPEAVFVYGKSHYIDGSGNVVGEYPTGEYDPDRIAEFNFITQPSVFFRRSVYFASGGLDKRLHYAMDYDLWIRMAKGRAVAYLPEYLSSYRLHGEAKTVSERHALEFHRETMETVMRHFGRAPINRVYAYCFHLASTRLPASLKRMRFAVVFFAIILTIKEYLKLNRGIRLRDLRLITPANIRRVFAGSDGRPGL